MKDQIGKLIIIVLIALLIALILYSLGCVQTIIDTLAEEPGNGVFPLQCLSFHPGRTYTWMDSCPLLPMVINDQPLIPRDR